MTPFPVDGPFDAIYTEHCLEHITERAAEIALAECYRVLVPGGLMKVVVPDADKIYAAYMDPAVPDSSMLNPHGNKDHTIINMLATPMLAVMTAEQIHETFQTLPKNRALDFFGNHLQDYDEAKQAENAGYHLTWWNYPKLISFMFQAGFDDFGLVGQQSSRLKAFRAKWCDRTAPLWSLRVEAVKPKAPRDS
jgi:SAM-dependent methyltransferase